VDLARNTTNETEEIESNLDHHKDTTVKNDSVQEDNELENSQTSKMMSIKLVNILADEEDHPAGDSRGNRTEKLKSVKVTLKEILDSGDLNEDEKQLLKDIKELVESY